MPDLYERRHTNGWIATAEGTPDQMFTALARERGGAPQWAT
jgi:hypothetical protein